MREPRLAACAALLCAAVASPAIAEVPCGASGETFIRTATMRVYLVKRTRPHRSSQVYACTKRARPVRLALRSGHTGDMRIARLFNPTVNGRPYDVRVAGHFVAYRLTWILGPDGRSGTTQALVVRNLRTRAVTFRIGRFVPEYDALSIESMVLTTGGAVGWIQLQNGSGTDAGRSVRLRDAAGLHLLDRGNLIDPTSLTLAGPNVAWTNDGERRSASLSS